jgi:SagB-type dehydrogenase family enzyme
MMQDILLPAPQLDLDYPLMEAIYNRRTKRKWSTEELSLQEVSDLLWCACGETKSATKHSKNRRTVPSACNSQIVHVYAALSTGAYRYDEARHALIHVTDSDIRCDIGKQKMMKSAPFGLIYVADFKTKTGIIKSDYGQKMFVGGTESGLMAQNVYLYCAAAGLNTVLIALTDRDYLKSALNLGESAEVIYTQAVGRAV